MSLKTFHIFFIAMSALMCFGIGLSRATAFTETGSLPGLAQAGACFVAGATLVGYGISFLKRFRGVSYL